MWPLGALLLFLAMLAIPVPILSITDGQSQIVGRLDDGAPYVYSYVNSVYGALVEERHVRRGDTLSITSVRSSDVRAVEYFRWNGDPSADGAHWQQEAPANQIQALTIRTTPQYAQRIAAEGWSVELGTAFDGDVISVAPGYMPVGLALLRGWRP